MDRLIGTVLGIVVALVASAIVFLGANKLFDLAPRKWTAFSTAIGGWSMFILFGLMWSNRLIDQPVTVTAVATVIGLAAGFGLASTSDDRLRLAVGAGAGVALGALAGAMLKTEYRPGLDPVTLVLGVGVLTAVGLGLWASRGRKT